MLSILLSTSLLWGQDIDHKRMKRDIAVAEKIIDALVEEVTSNSFQSYRIDGTYLDSYGMLFTITNKWGGFAVHPKIIGLRGTNLRGSARLNEEIRGSARLREEDGQTTYKAYPLPEDTIVGINEATFKTIVETFLADYGYLLSQLPDEERICIKYGQGEGGLLGVNTMVADFFPTSKNTYKSTAGFTAVIQQKFVEQYRTNNLAKATLVSKIEYSKTQAIKPETDREIIILNSIFTSLYQRDLSDGLFLRGRGNVEKIVGLGALFTYSFSTKRNSRFGSSKDAYIWLYDQDGQNSNNERLRRQLLDENEDEDETNEEEIDFDAFLDDFKANVIEYGSTVRNLRADEVLSFELHFPSCRNCEDWPEKIKITAKQSLLNKFRQRDIDLDDAVEQLQVAITN